jgi:hypothetical protein
MNHEQLIARLQASFDKTIEHGAADLRDAGHPFKDTPPKSGALRILFDAHYVAAMAYLDAIRSVRQAQRAQAANDAELP